MIWLTWRQFRAQAGTVTVLLAGFAVALAITGPRVAGLDDVAVQLSPTDESLYTAGLLAVYAIPAVIGVFWGVPLVAREVESGTHNLVWNQTVTRTRWLATKLAVLGTAATVLTGLLSLAVTWWATPVDAAADGGLAVSSRIMPEVFGARGIAPIGYAAFAFVLGVAAGILLRRTVVAMAVALVAFTAVQVMIPLLVRPHLVSPVEESSPITMDSIVAVQANIDGTAAELIVTTPPNVWLLSSETIDADGNAVGVLSTEVGACAPVDDGVPDESTMDQCFTGLIDEGYQQVLTYHPPSRFWPLQWVETGLFLAMTAALTWLCFRWTRTL